jgi:hypothetical protein
MPVQPGGLSKAARTRAGLVTLAAALAAAACGFANLEGRASDDWTRTYPLSDGGTVEIINTNGRIDFEPADGSSVEVRAERIAKAATDEGARDLLPRIKIDEEARHVRLETGKLGGVMIGASIEVRYHVRAPKSAKILARNTNGVIDVSNVTGPVDVRTTNGNVRGNDLSGRIDAQTTNGTVNIGVAKVTDHIRVSTTNGSVSLEIPADAKADLLATVTNGGISVNGLKLEQEAEPSRRRVEGKINGGGPSIEVHTTNGAVRVRARGASAS